MMMLPRCIHRIQKRLHIGKGASLYGRLINQVGQPLVLRGIRLMDGLRPSVHRTPEKPILMQPSRDLSLLAIGSGCNPPVLEDRRKSVSLVNSTA